MKSFDANMANNVWTWIGATSVANQDTLSTGEETSDVMSGINAIQTLLVDMQDTLNTLAGETTTPNAAVPTPTTEEATVKPTTTTAE